MNARILALMIVSLAACLRLGGIGDKPLWYDEICAVLRAEGRYGFDDRRSGAVGRSVRLTTKPVGSLQDVVFEPSELIPPLYHLGLRFWLASAPHSPAWLRLPSAIASTAAVAFAMWLLWGLWGWRAALSAGLLLAASPFEVAYAQEVRFYAQLGLCAVAATWALTVLAGAPEARWRWWGLYIVAVIVGTASHYTMVIVPVAHGLYWLWARTAALRRWPLAMAGCVVALAPLGWVLWQQLGGSAGSLPWTPEHTTQGWFALRAHIPVEFLSMASTLATGIDGPTSLGVFVFSLLVGASIYVAVRIPPARLIAILAWCGPLAILAIDIATAGHSLRYPRYAMVSSACLWICLALTLSRLPVKVHVALLVVILGVQGFSLSRAYGREGKYGDFRSCTKVLDADVCDERTLVISVLRWKRQIIELNQQLRSMPAQMLVEDSIDPRALQHPWQRIWVLVWESRLAAVQPLIDDLGRQRPLVAEHRFERLRLYGFGPPAADN